MGSFSLIPGVTFLAEIFLLRNSCLPLPPDSNISSYSPIAWKRKKWKLAAGLSDAVVEPRFSLRRRQHEVFKSSNVNQNVRGCECERHSSANWFLKLVLLCRHSEASTISGDTIADKMQQSKTLETSAFVPKVSFFGQTCGEGQGEGKMTHLATLSH